MNNNGWHKIEYKNDLPEVERHYWVVSRKDKCIKIALFVKSRSSQYKSLYSHWQPYIKPNLPLD